MKNKLISEVENDLLNGPILGISKDKEMAGKLLADSLSSSIIKLLSSARRMVLGSPRQLLFVMNLVRNQKKAAGKRVKFEYEGLHVPPFMIVSVTDKCNLNCKGCYSKALHGQKGSDLKGEELGKLFAEAGELAISIILLAGGEPLVRKDLLELAAGFPDILFPLFTNGLLIDEQTISFLKKHRNIIPVVSVEGYQKGTDDRRGEGVYEKVVDIFGAMGRQGLVYGTSITVTSGNFETVTKPEFVQELTTKGCKLFFYVEYVPVDAGTEGSVLEAGQEIVLLERLAELEAKYPALFIAFPGDEQKYGGCLAAGRGFIHVNSKGGVEPCPFAPYSDLSLKDVPLKEALQSEFLREIRNSHSMLEEGTGGCALWDKREWVSALLDSRKKAF